MIDTVIGAYGPWAAGLVKGVPNLSFRNSRFKPKNIAAWRKLARARLLELMAAPELQAPKPKVVDKIEFDGLDIETLSWKLPYGQPTQAALLKPHNVKGKLPGVLAFHCHGGKKFWGWQKIVRLPEQHEMLREHQVQYYGGRGWANELARRGYAVLVPDVFSFGSRRVRPTDCLEQIRGSTADPGSLNPASIFAYNAWTASHEHLIAKSLFSAGTTWPGVWWAEDRVALDILAARKDVDAKRLGCAGLSGGGMRTNFMAGLDDRIKCCVSVGFMTTWRDLVLKKCWQHTWMCYVPLLPRDLDLPEIVGLRAGLPTMIQSTTEDALFSLDQAKAASRQLKEIFTKAKALDKFQYRFYPGPHQFNAPMQEDAFAWMDKWLK